MVPGRTTITLGFWYHENKGWTEKATFDSEVECNRETLKGYHRSQNGEVDALFGPLFWARCMASDDPRLKEK
jgi:hypothetical protein